MATPRRKRIDALRDGPNLCAFPDCGKRVHSYGLCVGHAKQRRMGLTLRPIRPARPTPAPGFHWCSTCKVFKPIEDFRWDTTRRQPQRVCLWCQGASQRAWTAKHSERLNLQKRLRTHGLTEDEYRAMIEKQKGVCAICGVPDLPLDVDHCHTTGTVRGLLCGPCNRALGFMKDDTRLLRRAIRYLESHKQ